MKINIFNDLLLISDYGRSGQGWLSYMLSYILNARYIEPYDLLKGRPYSNNSDVLKYTSGNFTNRKMTDYSMIIKTHEYPADDFSIYNKVIFLTRDPRDIAVSAYNRYCEINKSSIKRLTLKNRIYLMINRLKLFSIIITAIRWKNHYRRWKSVNKIHVKYEDLLVDPHRVINSILDYLVIENTESQLIDDAINIFSFQNLTGRKPGEIDNSNLEFRTGTSGSYKNVFNKLEKYLFRIICGHVAKDAGYSL